jgi:Protein of unknown function (DUF2934)
MKHAATRPTSKTAAHQRAARSEAATTTDGSVGLPDGQAGDAGADTRQADAESRDVQIHRLAYERYLSNGCVDGHALDDWLAAEAAVGALGLGGDGAAADRQPGA